MLQQQLATGYYIWPVVYSCLLLCTAYATIPTDRPTDRSQQYKMRQKSQKLNERKKKMIKKQKKHPKINYNLKKFNFQNIDLRQQHQQQEQQKRTNNFPFHENTSNCIKISNHTLKYSRGP